MIETEVANRPLTMARLLRSEVQVCEPVDANTITLPLNGPAAEVVARDFFTADGLRDVRPTAHQELLVWAERAFSKL